jgi:hypothetical protein
MAIFPKFFVRKFLRLVSRGNEVTGDGHGIMIGFPEINVDAPTVFALLYEDLRTAVMHALESKHVMAFFGEFLRDRKYAPPLCDGDMRQTLSGGAPNPDS